MTSAFLNCLTCETARPHLPATDKWGAEKLDHWVCESCGTERHWGGAIVWRGHACPFCPAEDVVEIWNLIRETSRQGRS